MRHCCWLHIASLVAVVGLLISCLLAFGDIWGPPQNEHWSANNEWVLKVRHDSKTLSLCEKTQDGLKEHWRREYVDPNFAPLRAYVTDDGKYVVLLDLHGCVGSGQVVVILGRKGAILGSYRLGDFLPKDEIQQAERTVMSLWWNKHAWFSLIKDQTQFALVTQIGTVRAFDLPTGTLLDLSDGQRAEIVELVSQEAEAWVGSENAGERIRGITLLGGMGLNESIPAAKRLFHDKTRTGSVWRSGKPGAEIYGVQTAAAVALIRLMETDAIPIIEQELPDANWYMKEELLKILARLDTRGYEIVETPDSAVVTEMWKRLAQHPADDIRYPALCQVLRRDDGTYLFDHPELIESESDPVRATAVGLLGKVESPKAMSLLRKAINDKQEYTRLSALRHLIAREPSDIEGVLVPYLDDEFASIRKDVICELACRGNPAAIKKLQETIATWPTADLYGDDKWVRLNEIETLCKLAADLKLLEAKDGLESARSTEIPRIAISVNGALAALGDQKALAELHRATGEGDLSDRARAIEMCRCLDDEESAALVKNAAESDQRQLQYAATKDLQRFEDRR